MKSKLLELLSSDQDILKQMLTKCPPMRDTTPEDLLQDFYIFVFTKEYDLLTIEDMFPNGKMHQGLVFTVLKNFALGELRKDTARGIKKDAAYGAWKRAKLREGDERANNIASESNLLILDELKLELTDEEYNGIIDIVEKRLIFRFRDEQGNTDIVAYQAERYRLNKKYLKIKDKSSLFEYITPEEVDDFEQFSNLTLKIK